MQLQLSPEWCREDASTWIWWWLHSSPTSKAGCQTCCTLAHWVDHHISKCIADSNVVECYATVCVRGVRATAWNRSALTIRAIITCIWACWIPNRWSKPWGIVSVDAGTRHPSWSCTTVLYHHWAVSLSSRLWAWDPAASNVKGTQACGLGIVETSEEIVGHVGDSSVRAHFLAGLGILCGWIKVWCSDGK